MYIMHQSRFHVNYSFHCTLDSSKTLWVMKQVWLRDTSGRKLLDKSGPETYLAMRQVCSQDISDPQTFFQKKDLLYIKTFNLVI